MELKKVLIGLGIAGVITGGAYYLYKEYKRYIEEKEYLERQPTIGEILEMERIEAELASEEGEDELEEYEEEDEEEDEWDHFRNLTPEFDEEDIKVLVYEKNTQEAWEQYVNMMISDYDLERSGYFTISEIEALRRLFLADFELHMEAYDDEAMWIDIMDRRHKFFGGRCRFTDSPVSWAEVLLFYADAASYDTDEDLDKKYLREFLHNLNVVDCDDFYFHNLVSALNEGEFINPKTGLFGIFALTVEQANEIGARFNLTSRYEITLYKQYQKWIGIVLENEY